MNNALLCLTAGAFVLSVAGIASAETYRLSTFAPETSTGHRFALSVFADHVAEASDGEIEFETYYGGSLLPGRETLAGIGRGVADGGLIVGVYNPSDLPLDNVLNDASFTAENPMAASLASTELKLTHPLLQEEWKKNGTVIGASTISLTFILMCTTPVRTVEDLEGKKIRALGRAQIDFFESMGGISITVPANEAYTGLQRGSLDCAVQDHRYMAHGLRFAEVAKYATEVNLGTSVTGGTWVFNADFWKSLTDDQRRLLIDQIAIVHAKAFASILEDKAASIEEALGFGAELVKPDDGLVSRLAAYKETFKGNLPAIEIEARGIEDPSELLADYFALEKKWQKLLEGVDVEDVDAFTALIKTEIFDKVDETTYGLD